uniref:Uncharacterized protein n=1 Tax=Rhizophora mucronata TaxID=61149 RepID=A0A2P2QHV0_RHIMU
MHMCVRVNNMDYQCEKRTWGEWGSWQASFHGRHIIGAFILPHPLLR